MMIPMHILRGFLTICATCLLVPICNAADLVKLFPQMEFTEWMETNYKKVHPKKNISEPLPVVCGLYIYQLFMVDVKSGVFVIGADLTFKWYDEIVGEANISHLDSALYPADQVWLPDVIVKNSVDGVMKKEWRETFPVWIDLAASPPRVDWGVQDTFTLQCSFDIRWFPFDSHDCTFVLTTYMTSTSSISLSTDMCIDISKFQDNSEFVVKTTGCSSKESTYDSTIYREIEFQLRLERQPLFYIANIVLPCMALSLLSWFALFLPNDCGEKVSLEVTIMLTFSVFLLIVSDSVPKTSTVPLLGIYLLSLMLISMVSMVTTILVVRMHHHDKTQQMPGWARTVIFSLLARCVCHLTRVKMEHLNEGPTIRENHEVSTLSDQKLNANNVNKRVALSATKEDYSQEWKDAANILETITIIIMIIMLIALNVFCLCVAPALN